VTTAEVEGATGMKLGPKLRFVLHDGWVYYRVDGCPSDYWQAEKT
jgi:hypothetical protein